MRGPEFEIPVPGGKLTIAPIVADLPEEEFSEPYGLVTAWDVKYAGSLPREITLELVRWAEKTVPGSMAGVTVNGKTFLEFVESM